MTGWLRANAPGFAVIAVCLPLLAAVLVAVPLAAVQAQSDRPRSVAAGAAATQGGLTFRVRAVGAFATAQGLTTPKDTAVIAAIVDVTPATSGPKATFCSLRLGAPSAAGRREWEIANDATGYGYVESDDVEHDCSVSLHRAYRIEALFVAPAGTEKIGSIDVTLTEGQQQRTVRLRLPTPLRIAPVH